MARTRAFISHFFLCPRHDDILNLYISINLSLITWNIYRDSECEPATVTVDDDVY